MGTDQSCASAPARAAGGARPFTVVVSGVPRSGTSLVMRMLVCGGIPSLSDGARTPDADNPFGYRELEAVKRLPEDAGWLARAEGRAVKVVHVLLPRLLLVPDAPPLRVVLVRRRMQDVVASQEAMLARLGRGGGGLAPERLAQVLTAQLDEAATASRAAPHVSLLELSFEALLADPRPACAALDAFLGGGLDVDAMSAAVDPDQPRSGGGTGYTSAIVSAISLGSIRLEVEHRAPGPSGGPTLRVRAAAEGRELLRFDCFARGAHWHLDPSGRDEIHALAPGVDALAFTLEVLRSELPATLARAGHEAPLDADAQALAAALERVEAELRNPPPDFDSLAPALLRERGGEKWRTYPGDVLPLWVADQDYPVADPIRRVLQRALDLSDLGYPMHPAPTPLPGVFAERAARRYGWRVAPSRVELLTDVVQGIYVALAQLTEPGEGAIVQTPIYPPFLGAVRSMGRTLLENPLVEGSAGFEVDLEGLRRQAARGARILLLCHPHNPTGRVFERTELEAVAEVALAHDLWIVSDEIHADLVYPGSRHLPIAALSPEVEARTLTLTSASKAFNVAGLRCALAVFGSDELRKHFLGFPRHLRGGLGALGIEATLAAFRHADPWLARALAYLEANRDFVADFVARELPGVRHHPPQATYLAWLDFRELELAPSPYRFFLKEAKVALSDGAAFGAPGQGFARLNFATSRALLREALERMRDALRAR